jgi:hypothetical protein
VAVRLPLGSQAVAQGGPDAASPERAEDLEVAELGNPGKPPADLGLVGRLPAQEHVAHRPAIEPGDQQDPMAAPLPGQAVGEEVPLPEDGHQGGEVAVGGSPDLHLTLVSAAAAEGRAGPVARAWGADASASRRPAPHRARAPATGPAWRSAPGQPGWFGGRATPEPGC